MCALEQHALATLDRFGDFAAGVGDEWQEPIAAREDGVGDVACDEFFRAGCAQLLVGAFGSMSDQLARAFAVAQIGDTHAGARDLVLVGGADAATGRADPAGAACLLARGIEALVVLEEQVGATADADALFGVDTALHERIELVEELLEVEHHAVAEQAALLRVQDTGWYLVQNELVDLPRCGIAYMHGVTGVRATLIARDDAGVAGEHIDDLALTLIAPLRADDDETAVLLHRCSARAWSRKRWSAPATSSMVRCTPSPRRFVRLSAGRCTRR